MSHHDRRDIELKAFVPPPLCLLLVGSTMLIATLNHLVTSFALSRAIRDSSSALIELVARIYPHLTRVRAHRYRRVVVVKYHPSYQHLNLCQIAFSVEEMFETRLEALFDFGV